MAELGTWIRYSPPSSDVKPGEPWLDDEEEDGDPGRIQ